MILHDRTKYTPYGEEWIDKFQDENYVDMPYKFTGKERDEAWTITSVLSMDLYYYGARYLDPQTSVWLSTDPALGEYIPQAGKDNSQLPGMGGIFNLTNANENIRLQPMFYHYAGNNPVRYTDPDGKQSLPVFDLWKFLNLTDDPQIKILNTMKAADDGDQYAMDALKYVFHEASKQLLEESSSKMNDMSLICLCIGAPEGSAVFGTAATICDVILAFDKAINGEIKDAIKDGVYIVAGMVISEKIEKGVSKFSKGIQITVGENGRFYELAGKNPIKSEYALRKLIQKDIADGYFGKQILPNSQLIIEEAIKAYKKLKEVDE